MLGFCVHGKEHFGSLKVGNAMARKDPALYW